MYDAAGVCMSKKNVFEVHIIGYEGDLYGKNIEVDIVDSIRDNRVFDSDQELVDQIREDLKKIDELSTMYGIK